MCTGYKPTLIERVHIDNLLQLSWNTHYLSFLGRDHSWLLEEIIWHLISLYLPGKNYFKVVSKILQID